jgi:serine/threonine-protein phosphatase 2A regulatory subunit B'
VEELLEVMASIIAGFLIPLREDHINFFNKILIPLHKNKCEQYFEILNTCTILYLGKEPNLSYILLENLFKIFYTQTYKVKILFLEEIEIILNFIDIVKISNYVKDLINIIVGCFSEYDIDLKKKALPFLKNNIFISIIKAYKNISFNIIVPKLNHLISWDDESESAINSIKQTLKELESIKYYDALNSKLNKEINLFPKNEEEENRQIMIALELSQKENKIKKIYKKAVIINKNKNKNFKEKINLKKSLSDNIKASKNYEIKEEEFDEDFGICPITQEYMNNPVLCPSGNYYEKSAILDWLKKK